MIRIVAQVELVFRVDFVDEQRNFPDRLESVVRAQREFGAVFPDRPGRAPDGLGDHVSAGIHFDECDLLVAFQEIVDADHVDLDVALVADDARLVVHGLTRRDETQGRGFGPKALLVQRDAFVARRVFLERGEADRIRLEGEDPLVVHVVLSARLDEGHDRVAVIGAYVDVGLAGVEQDHVVVEVEVVFRRPVVPEEAELANRLAEGQHELLEELEASARRQQRQLGNEQGLRSLILQQVVGFGDLVAVFDKHVTQFFPSRGLVSRKDILRTHRGKHEQQLRVRIPILAKDQVLVESVLDELRGYLLPVFLRGDDHQAVFMGCFQLVEGDDGFVAEGFAASRSVVVAEGSGRHAVQGQRVMELVTQVAGTEEYDGLSLPRRLGMLAEHPLDEIRFIRHGIDAMQDFLDHTGCRGLSEG